MFRTTLLIAVCLFFNLTPLKYTYARQCAYYLHETDFEYLIQIEVAIESNPDYLITLSRAELEFIKDSFSRYDLFRTKREPFPHNITLTLAILEFHMTDGNNLDHVSRALQILNRIPAAVAFRNHRIMFYKAKYLIASGEINNQRAASRIANTLLGSLMVERRQAAINIAQLLISTNIGENIDAGLRLRELEKSLLN